MIQRLLNPKDIARSLLIGVFTIIRTHVEAGNDWYWGFTYFSDYPIYLLLISKHHCWFCCAFVLVTNGSASY